MAVLGIDIGGSGIKGAPVDITTGEMVQPRFRIPTPAPATPNDVAAAVLELTQHFQYNGPIGCGFPSVIIHGKAITAANIDQGWIGTDVAALFTAETGCQATVINDADAAGLAEMKFGAGKDYQNGVVILLTLGTGIGSAVFTDGCLVPNTEFGHLQVRGKDAEKRASDAVRQVKELSWQEWADRLNEYLQMMEQLFSPELIIIGGGVSKESKKFFPYLITEARVVPALLLNNAGIVGAALATERRS
ncbi:MAG: ROK family protein [Anaerolineaceae bacterium]|nr:ROK family protein [Anaerolineaceae bacterium]